jgi:hypothetical protein
LRIQSDLLLNPFIAGQLPHLMNQIQELAVCQYVVPFASVRLQVVTLAFDDSSHRLHPGKSL